MSEPPRDTQQLIARLMATNIIEPQPEEVQIEQLVQDAIRLTREITNHVQSVRHYYAELREWHADLQRREEELNALRHQDERTFTEEEIGAGKCYFRVLKKFEKYANKPYKNIWTRYNNLRKQITLVSKRSAFPENARKLAEELLEEMENKVCSSVQDVIAYTTHVYQQSLRIVGYLQYQNITQDLANAATELRDYVKDEIGT